jgi:hypothetical protein
MTAAVVGLNRLQAVIAQIVSLYAEKNSSSLNTHPILRHYLREETAESSMTNMEYFR